MNQDELLERLWNEVIDAAESDPALEARGIATRDVRHVARLARYEAVFAWCFAFDEAEIPITKWLAARSERRWRKLVAYDPTTLERPRAPKADEPFADSIVAWTRLLDAGVTGTEIAALMTREGLAALAALRAILGEETFEPGDLDGLHESLLSADPSGQEARAGSWPRPAAHHEELG